MNRTDRLYALVEELRAVAPLSQTARQLAERFEVSVRTIERDLSALQQAGVPIYATAGRGGGYALDKTHTLPPVNFTPEEATALAIALARPGGSPMADSLRSAVHKVVAAMPAPVAKSAEELASRVHFMSHEHDTRPPMARVVEHALVSSQVLRILYRDREEQVTQRDVEPLALVGSGPGIWYLVGRCRLRGGQRHFRLDRINHAQLTGEAAFPTEEPDFSQVPSTIRRLSLRE